MSRENIQGLLVKRLVAGSYLIEDRWWCKDVKGTTGWRIQDARHHERDRWFKSLSECKQWIDRNGRDR